MSNQTPSSASGPRAGLLVLGALAMALVFLAGLAIGQSGLLGSPGGVPSPTPVAEPGHPTPTPAGPTQPSEPGVTAAPIGTAEPLPSPAPGAPDDFALFWQAYDLIRQHFVGRDELDELPLTYGAIRGLVEALGDTGHSVFLTPEAVRRADESIAGRFVGIGVVLGERDGRTVVMSVISGGPASRSGGLRTGDVMLEVNGESVERLAPAEIAPLVRGDAGTQVTLRILRPATGETFELTFVREEIRLPAAEWAMVPGTQIALLRFNQFSQGSAAELRAARDAAIEQGAQALILDLRSNPGGLVHEAVEATSLFVRDGIVYIRELADGQRIPVPVLADAGATDLPLIVLIDEGTASSPEIMAGAIRSAGRAELVGTTTFGTGTVLISYPLADGSAIRLAIERWLTPEGELIFERGIAPTIEVALELDALPLSPDEVRELDPGALAQIEDTQLLRAIELLGGLP